VLRKFVFVVAISSVAAAAVVAGPKAKVIDGTMDFGECMQGVTLTHTFWVKSVGDEKLVITKTDPGCGCTQMPLVDSVLAPGESTPFHIVLSTKGFIGNISKRPSFETNDGSGPIYLKMFTYVLTDLASAGSVYIDPPRVDVSQFTVRPRRKARFAIVNHSDRDINVAVVDSSFKSFNLEVPELVKAHDSAFGQVTVHKNALKDDFQQSATFEFTGDTRTRFSMQVQRMYRPKDTLVIANPRK
jgi:hypothetical protein